MFKSTGTKALELCSDLFKPTRVKALELCDDLLNIVTSLEEDRDRAVKKNEEIKSGQYTKQAIEKLKSEKERISNRISDSSEKILKLSKEESDKINKWVSSHSKKHAGRSSGAIGGALTYVFTPSESCLDIEVECVCGEKIVLKRNTK